MQRFEVTVVNQVGLHARPAALFVKAASQFLSAVRVRNLTSGTGFVDAKGLLGILTLGVEQNHVIEVEIEGEDEAEAARTLAALVESDFVAEAG